jgi:hypothetical protein
LSEYAKRIGLFHEFREWTLPRVDRSWSSGSSSRRRWTWGRSLGFDPSDDPGRRGPSRPPPRLCVSVVNLPCLSPLGMGSFAHFSPSPRPCVTLFSRSADMAPIRPSPLGMGSILQKSEARNQKPENALAPATRPATPNTLLTSGFCVLASDAPAGHGVDRHISPLAPSGGRG